MYDQDVDNVDQSYIDKLESNRQDTLEQHGVDEGDILSMAQDDIGNWDGYFQSNVTRGKSDLSFTIRDQWTSVERQEFRRLMKPCLSANIIYDPVKKVLAEQRKDKPDLLVRSLTGLADQDSIDLRADIIRTICYQSQNDLVYQQAMKNALIMGFGAFEINIDYESPKSFNKVVTYDLITDPTLCAFDASAIKPHKGDGNFCARKYIYSLKEFYAEFPHIVNPISYIDPYSLVEYNWQVKDSIVVCKYTKKEWYPTTIYKLSNGMTVNEDEWKNLKKQIAMQKELANQSLIVGNMINQQIPEIIDEKRTKDFRIKQYKLINNYVLDCTIWPSKYLPLIFVDGDSNYIQGQQYTKSFIHDAIDMQKFYNYLMSETAAEFKNRRREQWVATPANIKGHDQMWRNPEVQLGALIAEVDPKTGQLPQRMAPAEIPQSLLAQTQNVGQVVKQIIGYYDEALGQQTNAESGVAIRNRQISSSMTAYIFRDNLNQSIEQSGRVVLDLLPAVYGADQRHMVLTKQDGSTRNVVLNQQDESGEVLNQIYGGDFDIEIDTGPSFAVQKELAVQLLAQSAQLNPQVFPMIADLWAENLDLQNMPQIVERFKNLVPPAILAKEAGEPPPPPQPDPQQQMMQMEMQSKQQELQDRQQSLQLKQQQHEIEKARLAMDLQELQLKQQEQNRNHSVEMKKADMSYTTDMTRILADLHKSTIPKNQK